MDRDSLTEQRGIDAITHGMLSASLLEALNVILLSEKRDQMTVGEFYDWWARSHQSARFTPFNEGVVLAFLYLGVLFARENWKELVPDDELSSWKLSPVRLVVPKKPRPKLKYFVRRIRNSLAHGSPTIHVPQDTSQEELASAITITFRDVNQKNASDTFDAELTLQDAFHLAKMLHLTFHTEIANRYQVAPPSSTG